MMKDGDIILIIILIIIHIILLILIPHPHHPHLKLSSLPTSITLLIRRLATGAPSILILIPILGLKDSLFLVFRYFRYFR